MKLSPTTLRRLLMGAGVAIAVGASSTVSHVRADAPAPPVEEPAPSEPQAFPEPDPSASPAASPSPGASPALGCPSGNASPQPKRDPCYGCGRG